MWKRDPRVVLPVAFLLGIVCMTAWENAHPSHSDYIKGRSPSLNDAIADDVMHKMYSNGDNNDYIKELRAIISDDDSVTSDLESYADESSKLNNEISEDYFSNTSETSGEDRNYTTTSSRISATYLDLDEETPGVDELYEQLVLVTGFSDNHYKEAMGFIGTAQKMMPNKRIIVYDLGINNEENLNKTKQLCNVEVRKFPFEDFPPHVKKLHSYAFKVAVINMSLNEFGAIYWGDASIRFRGTLKDLIPGIERYHGWYPKINHFNPLKAKNHHSKMTRHQTYDEIGVNRTEYFEYAKSHPYSQPHVQAGNQLIFNSSTVQEKMLKPWVKCAMVKNCIAPLGSNLYNHRFDASALTLIAYKNWENMFLGNDTHLEKIENIVKVSRGTNGFSSHPQYCSS